MRLGVSSSDSGLSGLSGIISTFSPLNVKGLLLWLRADSGTFSDTAKTTPAVSDGNVGAWADKSGNVNDALQSVEANKPQLKINDVNGQPALRFNGSSDFLTIATLNLGLTTNDNITIFTVVKPDNSGVNKTVWGNLVGATNDQGILMRYNSAETLLYLTRSAPPISASVLTAAGSDVNYTIITGAIDSGTMKLFRNGTQEGGTAAQQDMTGHSTSTYIGTMGDTAAQWYDGNMAEFMIYNSALSDTNRELVESYLNNRYAVY